MRQFVSFRTDFSVFYKGSILHAYCYILYSTYLRHSGSIYTQVIMSSTPSTDVTVGQYFVPPTYISVDQYACMLCIRCFTYLLHNHGGYPVNRNVRCGSHGTHRDNRANKIYCGISFIPPTYFAVGPVVSRGTCTVIHVNIIVARGPM